jgi:hypothetical protein
MKLVAAKKKHGCRVMVPPAPHIDGRKCTADEIGILKRWVKTQSCTEWWFKTLKQRDRFMSIYPTPDGIMFAKVERLGTMYF